MQRQSAVEVRTEPKRRSPEEFQFVKHRVEAGVARMTLNRPDHHNPLTPRSIRELLAAVQEAEDDAAASVIVIRSTGRSFSAFSRGDTVSRV